MKKTVNQLLIFVLIMVLLVVSGGCAFHSNPADPANKGAQETGKLPDSGEEKEWELVRKAMEILGDTSPVIVLTGEEVINGEICLLFAAGENSADGGKFTALHHYAISESGIAYYLDILRGGEWIYVESDAPEEAAWWGKYHGEVFKLHISNYNGRSFWFSFVADDRSKFEGVAPVYPQEVFKAEYMDLVFSLSDDASSVTVTQWEIREDSAERSQFTGVYTRAKD